MPKVSAKTSAINSLMLKAIADLVVCEEEGSDDTEIDEILDSYFSDISVVLCKRYFVPFLPGSVASSRSWWTDVLPSLDEGRFKQLLRVDWNQFAYILKEIEADPLFSGKHSKKQYPVEYQLALTLYRLGSSGEGASYSKIARIFGCGDGGTIIAVTKRVLTAIVNKMEKYLFWPSNNEKRNIIASTFHELPHCIGYVDGTEIPLDEKPFFDHESFYSRKQQYSIKAQAVCDHQLKVRHLVAGYPGSVHDARIFLNSSLNLSSDEYFNNAEWIAGDSAYPLKTTVIAPFKRYQARTARQKKFNKIFSKYRVRIEHCFGVIKERFNSLKKLKINITNRESIMYACQWITACCILHNMLIKPGDSFNIDQEASDTEDSGDEYDCDEGDESGINKRNALLELVLD